MSKHPSLTLLVGVGAAGIDILRRCAASNDSHWNEKNSTSLKFVAIDTDAEALRETSDTVRTIQLSNTEGETTDHQQDCPYLTSGYHFTQPGSDRQRPVGRYLLEYGGHRNDNGDTDKIKSVVYSLLERHHEKYSDFRQINIFHLYALGGGTGSGTFPLIGHSLKRITESFCQSKDMYAHITGIGLIPEMIHNIGQGFTTMSPQWEPRTYANAYAALRDLEKLMTADQPQNRPISDYSFRSKTKGKPKRNVAGLNTANHIDNSPYRHHFLVGIDEDRIQRSERDLGPESYREEIENSVAVAVRGMAMLGNDIGTWLAPPANVAHFGVFGHSQLSVPIEEVRRYCDLVERIRHLRDVGGPTGTELETAIAEKEKTVDSLTSGEYGDRIGYLKLNEKTVRNHLDKRTLEENLTSLRAFYEEGYLARDLREVMNSRIQQAYAWESPLFSWSEENEAKLTNNGGNREIWMLCSDENTSLPRVEPFGVGDHRFRRSGDSTLLPYYSDPYTIQYLTYAIDFPVSALQVYTKLDAAAQGGELDRLLTEWGDYRHAFAYPEWYGRDIRGYFGVLTNVTLPKLPELDLETVRIEKTGENLVTWLRSHGIASYLWLADEWARYEGFLTEYGTQRVGWKTTLQEYNITYYDIRKIVPNGTAVKQWFTGENSWDWLLTEIKQRFSELEGIRANFENP